MAGCDEKRSLVVSPIWRVYTASAGIHSSSTNFSTCLAYQYMCSSNERMQCRSRTMSSVFFARSLTNGRAMTGIRSLAGMWPFWLLLSIS
jgi:hypothetical protein